MHVNSVWQVAQSWFSNHPIHKKNKERRRTSHVHVRCASEHLSTVWDANNDHLASFLLHQPCFVFFNFKMMGQILYKAAHFFVWVHLFSLPKRGTLVLVFFQINQTLGLSVPLVWKCDKYSIILPVNVKEGVTRVVEADGEKKKSHIRHFLPGCCGTSQTHHRFFFSYVTLMSACCC